MLVADDPWKAGSGWLNRSSAKLREIMKSFGVGSSFGSRQKRQLAENVVRPFRDRRITAGWRIEP
jgi:hypothetical protein